MRLTLKRVPIEQIDPNPNNPRRGLGDIAQLAASIEQAGIIQPPIVRNGQGEDGDRYILVAGHRRIAAAKKVGLTEVDVLVRDGEAVEELDMLVENLQRSDLDPVEEATGYLRAVGVGMTQKDLAKAVGRSASHVAARMKLLELPAQVLAFVKKGELDAAEALHLLDVDGNDDDRTAIAATAIERRQRVEYLVDRHNDEVAEAAKIAELTEKYQAKGITVLDTMPEGAKRLSVEVFFEGDRKAGEKAHAKEACHAVVLRSSWGRVLDPEAVCTEPKRHSAKGESAVKFTRNTTGSGLSPTERAKRKQERQDQEEGRAFLGQHLRRLPANAEVIGRLAGQVIDDRLRQDTQRVLCEVFDLEPTVTVENIMGWDGESGGYAPTGKTRNVKDFRAPLEDFMAADPKNEIRVAYALTFCGFNTLHTEQLVDLGYEHPQLELPE